MKAAGILFVAPSGRVLFVRRTNEDDHDGTWALPGGGIEGKETPEQAARREAEEECGGVAVDAIEGELEQIDERELDGVTFTTFKAAARDPFIPELNDEHDGFIWAFPGRVPSPLHPGVAATLSDLADGASQRYDWTEGQLEVVQPEDPRPAPTGADEVDEADVPAGEPDLEISE